MSDNAIYLVTVWAIPVIIAITFHEAAHGFVTHLLGDDTAWRLGRVSFNPVKHIDPFGTILLPSLLLLLRAPFLFGYAKPVPVNFQKLRSPRRILSGVWVERSEIGGPGEFDHFSDADLDRFIADEFNALFGPKGVITDGSLNGEALTPPSDEAEL